MLFETSDGLYECAGCEVAFTGDADLCDRCTKRMIVSLNTKYGINNSKREEEKMNVTIIGSYNSTRDKMVDCKEYWERFGHKVHCPCDPGRENIPLIEKQSTCIDFIKQADLVVVIPKKTELQEGGKTSFLYEFGESTSYEMAIAMSFNKQLMIW